MTLNAYRDGQVISAESMNQLIQLQPFTPVYEGSAIKASLPSVGAYQYSNTHAYVMPFTMSGTRIDRVTLTASTNGPNSNFIPIDMVVQIRRGMIISQPGNDGTLIAERVIPWEWIFCAWDNSMKANTLSIPFAIRSGLTNGEQLFLCLDRVGDTTNNLRFSGATGFNASYPTYRRAAKLGEITSSDVIEQAPQLRYEIYAGDTGDMVGTIYGGALTQIEYNANGVFMVCRYLPPGDTNAGGVRGGLIFSYASGILTGAEVY